MRVLPVRWRTEHRPFLKGPSALPEASLPSQPQRGRGSWRQKSRRGTEGTWGQPRPGTRAPPAPLRGGPREGLGRPRGDAALRPTRPGPAPGAERHLHPLTCKSRALGGRPLLRGCRSRRLPAAGAAGTSPSGCAPAAPPSAILWRRWRGPGGAGPAPPGRPPWQREGPPARRPGFAELYSAHALQQTKPSAFIPCIACLSVLKALLALYVLLLMLVSPQVLFFPSFESGVRLSRRSRSWWLWSPSAGITFHRIPESNRLEQASEIIESNL